MKLGASLKILLLLVLSLGMDSEAQVIAIAPFTGALSETWESFPTTFDGNEHDFTPSPSFIMGGNATIMHPAMRVYQSSGTPYLHVLGTSGLAQTSDGIKAMTAGSFAQSVAIDFLSPQLAFGAYWGAWTHTVFGSDPATLSVDFYDGSNQLIDTELFTYSRSIQQDGILEWHGWASDTPFSRIVYTGDYPTIDGLQATTIPEPAAIFPIALGAIVIRRRHR